MRKTPLLFIPAAGAAAFALAPAALAGHTGATINVTAGKPSNFAFTLSAKSAAHGSITFKVTNGDSAGLSHDFKLCSSPAKSTAMASLPNSCAGKATAMIGKGATATLTVTVAKAGNYEYLCTVPGHAAGGMKGVLKVT